MWKKYNKNRLLPRKTFGAQLSCKLFVLCLDGFPFSFAHKCATDTSLTQSNYTRFSLYRHIVFMPLVLYYGKICCIEYILYQHELLAPK